MRVVGTYPMGGGYVLRYTGAVVCGAARGAGQGGEVWIGATEEYRAEVELIEERR